MDESNPESRRLSLWCSFRFSCGESESQEDLQVGFLFQEKATKIPMCGNWICGLEEFEKGLKSRIGNCEFNKICGINK